MPRELSFVLETWKEGRHSGSAFRVHSMARMGKGPLRRETRRFGDIFILWGAEKENRGT